ncbi:Phosphoglycerate dehydrogenase [Fodinibius roseus]|uniref:Phosphoglycerate dehydrogenase n=1 Tax=Fodinibius roseus TaxID=1194090 RepID=A0A1M4YW11_9BACT|nr:2-hydroxyacid dehydrogenase [Fodinibius roseus]SHF09981.1 Phosphoglycerate dehydrogenase [Fodinibius roseus]
MNILFCGEGFSNAIDHLKPLLSDYNLRICPENRVQDHVAKTDVIIPFITNVDEKLMKQGNFGLVQQFGVGLGVVDIEAATRNKIWVARVPSAESGNAESVAEHAIMLMMMLSRKFHEIQNVLQAREVGRPIGQTLFGKRACIIGLGGIGRALARRLHSLDMHVTGIHEYPERGVPSGVDRLFGLSDYTEAVHNADYVILCLNYRVSRHHFIDKPELQAIKPGAFFINIARGGFLNHDALLHILQTEHLAGAGLDVFAEEPVNPDHPLFQHNVIATPHIGGVTNASFKGTARIVVDNINRYAQGKEPLYSANNI